MHYELTKGFGAALTVDSTRNYSTGIARSLATREEALHLNMLQRLCIADNANG